LKRLMEINPTYCLTIEIVPFRNSDLLVAYGSLIREVRQAASLLDNICLSNYRSVAHRRHMIFIIFQWFNNNLATLCQ
jgi:hypothetical protein